MDTDLTGKVALVTGGGSGIGEAACHTLARAGAAVAVVDLRPEPARAVAETIAAEGGKALALTADVGDEAAVSAAVRRTVEEFGGLHVVFANAGINGMHAPIEEMTLEEWHATMDTNLTGTFLTVKHSIPHLRAAGGGAIVITASVNGNRLFSLPGYSAYSTSKAGQVAFSRMAAVELARWNIRVNAILPGAIRTNIGERTYQRNLARSLRHQAAGELPAARRARRRRRRRSPTWSSIRIRLSPPPHGPGVTGPSRGRSCGCCGARWRGSAPRSPAPGTTVGTRPTPPRDAAHAPGLLGPPWRDGGPAPANRPPAQPMLDDHRQHCGLDLREHAPGVGRAPRVHALVAFPAPEEQRALPAGADEHQRRVDGQVGGGAVVTRTVQAHRARRAALTGPPLLARRRPHAAAG